MQMFDCIIVFVLEELTLSLYELHRECRPNRNLLRLTDYARSLRVANVLNNYLEISLSWRNLSSITESLQNEKLEWTKLCDQLGLSKGLSNEQIGLFFESLMKPVAASKLRVILGYTNATKFKNSYIVPLMEQGLVVMSQPDKPNSPTKKYYLTEKGKRVIGSVGEEKWYNDVMECKDWWLFASSSS